MFGPLMTAPGEDHKLVLAAQILNSGGAIRLQALGTSMLPSIWPGDVLVIESKSGAETVPGDIVLVARDGRFVVHRLVEKLNSHWITRGDSVPQNDPPATAPELLGRVSAIHRKHRVFIPQPRVSRSVRTLSWMLCRWGGLRNIALRVHSLRQDFAPFSLFPRRARISGIAPPARAVHTHEYFADCG